MSGCVNRRRRRGWAVSPVQCIACYHEWISVYPVSITVELMECPKCSRFAGKVVA